jgi:hypothetical protein
VADEPRSVQPPSPGELAALRALEPATGETVAT